ncbi:MAG: hypothetical protein U5R14_10030 [Gemmatimonadota bacterium]|nr:hypothetical protein [Gemmatimonadota bacterium]
MNDRASTLLGGRRERIERVLGRELGQPSAASSEPLPRTNRIYLLDEAKDLYWNELEWENLMDEEAVDEGPLTELIFPGFLTYVRGLMLREVMPDAKAPANPRPQVVEDILVFLAGRVVALEERMAGPDEESQARLTFERDATAHLLDLTLYVFHELTPEEIERVEADRQPSP